MSRRGNCWDNAVAESFFKTIKTELIYTESLLPGKRPAWLFLSISRAGITEKEGIRHWAIIPPATWKAYSLKIM
jgi:transposase InsO family protein